MSDTLLPVPKEWKERALIDGATYERKYAESIGDPDGFWREAAHRLDWIKPFTKVKDVSWDPDDLHISWFEDGALNVCRQLHRPASAETRGNQTAIIWEGDDPQGQPPHHLCRAAPRGLPLRQCAEGARREERRPRHDLPADDPGSGLRDARLRAHRRGAFGDLRRLLARQPRGPHPGLRHRPSCSPRTKACAAASRSRSRRTPTRR